MWVLGMLVIGCVCAYVLVCVQKEGERGGRVGGGALLKERRQFSFLSLANCQFMTKTLVHPVCG